MCPVFHDGIAGFGLTDGEKAQAIGRFHSNVRLFYLVYAKLANSQRFKLAASSTRPLGSSGLL
jgi:hypothetical protein